ncbi:MAG TPA: copper homeostasis membrane protein CopD [Thermoanaerobaculia bacterium]|nr:copper homeostasis membrane protein CopD [Thermoanaerobaculia bacterium]
MEDFLIAVRTLHFAAAITLTGVLAFERLVAGPAFRHSGGVAATGLRRRLGWLAWASLVLALVSGAAWLVVVAAGMSGKPLSVALTQGAVPVVLTRTRFGEDWLLRFAVAVLLGFCLLGQRWRAGGAIGWVALILAALMLGSLAWAAHGAATPGPPGDLHLTADIFHLLGAGLWLGTLPPLILLLAEARRPGDADWAAVARTAIRSYSRLAVASVTVLLAGGVVNTWFLAGTVPALVGTEYGHLLLAKIGLFIAMLLVAAVNLLRLAPRLAGAAGDRNVIWRTVTRLQSNARIETALGLGVLAIVGALGTLPPGLHSEPGWPFPFRLDIDALTVGSQILLAILAVAICLCAVAGVAAAAAGHYRRMASFAASLALCLAVGWIPLRRAVERAYPTSYYASAEPYATASVVRGAAVYAENCALCHGATGRGDGPAAASLPSRPADLTEPHLFAHSPGDLFWWVSRGMDEGVMPGFAGVLNSDQRWDVINFIRARAAGVLAREIGPEVTTAAAPEVPDFTLEAGGVQQTLRQVLQTGPVLLVLFAPPAPVERLQQLAAAQPRLGTTGLQVLAVGVGTSPDVTSESSRAAPFVVGVSSEASSALALFRAAEDGGETELLLDRAGNLRARWTSDMPGGLAPSDVLVADAGQVDRIAAATPSHAGHSH